ncbi:unannotated protein [freshwater metagenome]|uniref:Unannotated protein n=1 Tax=freshwater metagenome TaxID=449393 RepID=A0A6J6KPU2_9ZZZZ
MQLGAVSPVPHNNTVVANNGNDAAPGVSFDNGVYVWFVSYASLIASGEAVGTGGSATVGVMRASAISPRSSAT